jgi:hypothetical protein
VQKNAAAEIRELPAKIGQLTVEAVRTPMIDPTYNAKPD